MGKSTMTYLRMNSALREWLKLPDGVFYGMVGCDLLDHPMRGVKPASVTKKVARL